MADESGAVPENGRRSGDAATGVLQLADRVPSRRRGIGRAVTALAAFAAAIAVLQFGTPIGEMEQGPFAGFLTKTVLPTAHPSATAFGASGEVKLRFAMPSATISYPLDVQGDPSSLAYVWRRVGTTSTVTEPKPLVGSLVVAPRQPGFYRLALVGGNQIRVVEELTLAVLVPFEEKENGFLRGYRIGTYIAERVAGRTPPPEGFLEISARDVDIPITRHLKVGDFLNHDRQDVWPRYAAVSPLLLDKIELVVAEIARWHGDSSRVNLDIDVHSGFRAPDHNRRVSRAASDSQHQYGDAADVAIDADGDGKLTGLDSRMVGLAVEIVELKHPDLVGGLGIYTRGYRGRSSYVHIDARGRRARWRG